MRSHMCKRIGGDGNGGVGDEAFSEAHASERKADGLLDSAVLETELGLRRLKYHVN